MNIIDWNIDTENCKYFHLRRAGYGIGYVIHDDGRTTGHAMPHTCFMLYGGDKYVSFITHESKRKVKRYLRQQGLTYRKPSSHA